MALAPTILVTGGAGFIGSNFVLEWFKTETGGIVIIDKLTYAANLENLKTVWNNPGHVFVHGDINDRHLVNRLLLEYYVCAIVHFTAESHVDRSIVGPDAFI